MATPGLALGRTPAVQAVWGRLVEFDRDRPHIGDALVAVAMRWKPALNFAITFADRFPAAETR